MKLQADPKRGQRYEQLRRELAALNMLESSVVLALLATTVTVPLLD